jgi:predicted Ser/Thr protein kinase
MSVFEELRNLTKDRTVYEFLQFEPRGKYHNIPEFIDVLEKEFAQQFNNECVSSMGLVEEVEYELLLKQYVNHVVAQIKKEKVWDPSTSSNIEPSEVVMKEIEKIIGLKSDPIQHRETLLSRIAIHKIENPKSETDVVVIFSEIMDLIKNHFYSEKKSVIDSIFKTMLELDKKEHNLSQSQSKEAKQVFATLEKKYGYDSDSSKECLKFIMRQAKK